MTAAGTAITVTWAAPPGHVVVDSYRIWFDVSDPFDVDATELRHSVADLVPGSWHQVRVATVVAANQSEAVLAEVTVPYPVRAEPPATTTAAADSQRDDEQGTTAGGSQPRAAEPAESAAPTPENSAAAPSTPLSPAAPLPPAPPTTNPQDLALLARGVRVLGATLTDCREYAGYNPATEKDVSFVYAIELSGRDLADLRVAGPGTLDRDASWLEPDGSFRGHYRFNWRSGFPGDTPPSITVSTVDVYDSVSGQWYRDVTMASPITFAVDDCSAFY